MTVNLLTLDANGDCIENKLFPFVEDAMEAANTQAGETLEWGECGIGYEAIPESGQKALHERGEYPARYFQIIGYDEVYGDVEILEEHHRD